MPVKLHVIFQKKKNTCFNRILFTYSHYHISNEGRVGFIESFEKKRAAFIARLREQSPTAREQAATVDNWLKINLIQNKRPAGGFERDYDGSRYGGRDIEYGTYNNLSNGKDESMASKTIMDLDSLVSLIYAVNTYANELQENYAVLRDAATVCDEAMGSDYIMQNKILPNYNEGLQNLIQVMELVSDVQDELQKELEMASSFSE